MLASSDGPGMPSLPPGGAAPAAADAVGAALAAAKPHGWPERKRQQQLTLLLPC